MITLSPSDAAQAVLSFAHAAVPWTQVALDPPIIPHMPVFRRFHNDMITLFIWKRIPKYDFSTRALYRHLGKLTTRRMVKQEDGYYRLARPENPLGQTFLAIATA